jgi:hypothetical protein
MGARRPEENLRGRLGRVMPLSFANGASDAASATGGGGALLKKTTAWPPVRSPLAYSPSTPYRVEAFVLGSSDLGRRIVDHRRCFAVGRWRRRHPTVKGLGRILCAVDRGSDGVD